MKTSLIVALVILLIKGAVLAATPIPERENFIKLRTDDGYVSTTIEEMFRNPKKFDGKTVKITCFVGQDFNALDTDLGRGLYNAEVKKGEMPLKGAKMLFLPTEYENLFNKIGAYQFYTVTCVVLDRTNFLGIEFHVTRIIRIESPDGRVLIPGFIVETPAIGAKANRSP